MDHLVKILSKSLDLPESSISVETSIYSTPEWDSISHMSLIFEIESAFSLHLTGDEIALMQSYPEISSLLAKKNVDIKLLEI